MRKRIITVIAVSGVNLAAVALARPYFLGFLFVPEDRSALAALEERVFGKSIVDVDL